MFMSALANRSEMWGKSFWCVCTKIAVFPGAVGTKRNTKQSGNAFLPSGASSSTKKDSFMTVDGGTKVTRPPPLPLPPTYSATKPPGGWPFVSNFVKPPTKSGALPAWVFGWTNWRWVKSWVISTALCHGTPSHSRVSVRRGHESVSTPFIERVATTLPGSSDRPHSAASPSQTCTTPSATWHGYFGTLAFGQWPASSAGTSTSSPPSPYAQPWYRHSNLPSRT
mmetsp:Transcript_1024/g.4200  ORF Transcript_1024/g.4200 Transcript_1024/m.4200 type:complete len:224 (+) Transcript_1024:715-1386(+)